MMLQYQHVDLIFDQARKALAIQLPENAKRINPCLRGLFSYLTQDVTGGLHKVQEVVTRICETPSYRQLVDSINFRVKSEAGEVILKPITVANLEIYLVFASALKVNSCRRLIAKGLRMTLALEPHIHALHHSLIVSHDIDCALVIAQVVNLIGFLPRFCRSILGLQDIEDALNKLHRRRVWHADRRIPQLFKDQFPTAATKSKRLANIQASDGGGSGHNMLNPKKTQEPKPKDDMTPLKTRPGRNN
jgi:hypothetical protein